MEDLFIGVDGGGTKTEAIIQTKTGQIIGYGQAGPGNIKTSPAESFNSMQNAVVNALSAAGIKNQNAYRLHAGLGMAGTEVPEARSAFLAIPHSFHTMVLGSDALVACLGVHGGRDGSIIIIGTGVIGFQMNNGKTNRISGYGFPHSDEGGGAWMGLELLRATFQAYDGIRAWSPILEQNFSRFNHDITMLTSFANAAVAKPNVLGQFAPLVIEYFKRGDVFAKTLIEQAVQIINQLWESLIHMGNIDLPCCLLGGIASFLKPYLSESLKSHLKPREMDAPHGAILMLKKQMGLLL